MGLFLRFKELKKKINIVVLRCLSHEDEWTRLGDIVLVFKYFSSKILQKVDYSFILFEHDKSGLLEVFHEEFISTRKITPKKIRKETVQLLYMKRLIYLKNGQSTQIVVLGSFLH
jgi:hypothetical protein